MHLWKMTQWKTYLNLDDPNHRTGLRFRFDKNVEPEVRTACIAFSRWLRSTYSFPMRVIVYVKDTERIRAMDGDMVCGTFFMPGDMGVEPYARVAAGDYKELYKDLGKYAALGCILETITHELSHYFQWVNQLPLTQIGEERQATRYAKLIINEYIDAYGILGEVGTSKLFTAETQEDLVMKVQTIQHCLKNHIAASVYYDMENRGRHFTGYIAGHDSEHLLIAHISAHGLYDGFILKRIEDIYRIDYDGSYEKKIDTLYRVKQQSHPDPAEITESHSILKNALHYAQNHKLIVSVLFQEFFFSGWVNTVDEESLSLKVVTEYGEDDGHSEISLDAIESVYIDTDDEQDLKLLSELK